MQIIYAYYKRANADINQTEKELFDSINKSYELYHYLMLLLIELKYFAQNKLEIRKNKFLKSQNKAELSENFVNNRLIALLEINTSLNTYINNNKFSWQQYNEVLALLYEEIEKSDEFIKYQLLDNTTFKNDKEIIFYILSNVITNSVDFNQLLEELSLYWNDDLEFVVSNVIQTLSKFKEEKKEFNTLMRMYRSDEDITFVKDLFRKTILKHEEHIKKLEYFLHNWDIERIAQIDIILLEMAMTELYYLEEVPVKVTLNEYIELSKFYSTDKSSTFINGILDAIVREGKADGSIVKRGKGLIGEQNNSLT